MSQEVTHKEKEAKYYRELVKRMADRVEDAAALRRAWSILERARICE